mgnify:CR=1 FL=1
MSASAHTVVEAHSHSGFISGFVHPLFGLDHLRLTYRFQGRDFRLTDISGEVIKKVLI